MLPLPLWTVQLGNNLPKETEERGPWRERSGSSGTHKDLEIEGWLNPIALRTGHQIPDGATNASQAPHHPMVSYPALWSQPGGDR